MLEKLQYRARMREGSMPDEPRMAAWRRRQVNRCVGELGSARAEAIVHAPAAFELAKGCTVGCWFCGVAAPKFDHTWPHTPQTALLWRETLAVLRDVIGACAQHAFLYWATDPLDNPDYERFLTDFYEVLGRCPQTTTALAQKDIERTRRLLRLVRSMNSTIDRFSIIALNSLHRVHDGLSAEEMLRVECVPQNREAAWLYRKSGPAARASSPTSAKTRWRPAELGSTIACVSGFLFNMIDRSVKLITPCNANDRWPLGYWVLSQGTFGSPGELRELLRSMIADLRSELRVTDVIRLRPDLRLEPGRDQLHVRSLELRIAFDGQPCLDHLAELLSAGSYTAADIAWTRQRVDGVPLAQTFALLSELFDQGLTDEEPAVPQAAVPEPAGPERGTSCRPGGEMTARASAAGKPDVCLVSMPYAELARPPLAVGLLKGMLAERRHPDGRGPGRYLVRREGRACRPTSFARFRYRRTSCWVNGPSRRRRSPARPGGMKSTCGTWQRPSATLRYSAQTTARGS